MTGSSKPRVTPCVYLVPDGFAGWATICFAVTGAEPLVREDGARLIRIPADGYLETSSPQELGILNQRFYFVDGAGTRTPLDRPAAKYGADPNAAWKQHDRPVVLGFHTGTADDDEGHHMFERFYVGHGPAGDPPGWRSRAAD